ncbi:MAG TPA: nuclear transport factor 2 family protein [Acidimicrobiales bacterium]|nr:nuclear transport factor 2 family protein [Acidimicrobiales bacterium]
MAPDQADVEKRLRILEDAEAIRNLQGRFWLAADGVFGTGPTHDYEAMVDTFTEDGTWILPGPMTENGPIEGVEAHGGEELLACFKIPHERQPISMHVGAAPIIEVDGGDTARGRWKLLGMMTAPTGQSFWAGALYDVAYRRTDQGWRIETCTVVLQFNTPFDGNGWGDVRFVPLARHLVNQ